MFVHFSSQVSTMTPLQILCSFQIWNAKPISVKLHKGLSEVASYLKLTIFRLETLFKDFEASFEPIDLMA